MLHNDTQIDIREKLASLIILSATKGFLKKAVFSKPANTEIKKMVMSVKVISDNLFLQAEYFKTDNKAIHKNIPLDNEGASQIYDMIEEFSQINLISELGECEYKRSSSGKEVLIGGDKLLAKLHGASKVLPQLSTSGNNREKKYILNGSEPFLMHLGVSDKSGRVYDKKQSKFRQINRFLELIRDIEDKLPKDEITISDLCCGKSYLSFAVYHYFSVIKNYKVNMYGVDLKSDVIEHCSATAKALGFDGLEFICANVSTYQPPKKPSLVISLHACDIATDFVLDKAVEWQVDVIMSTPCCHHEMNRAINAPELSFITDYSMLRQKLCDAATDALRLCRLEAEGYSTMALELIDPDETPKNIMLRAVRKKSFKKDSEAARVARERYESAKKFLCSDNSGLHC